MLGQFYRELERTAPAGIERRFVLYYERNNSSLEKLKTVLNRYRTLPSGSPLSDAALNQEENAIVDNVNSLLDDLGTQKGFENLNVRREELLRRTHIHQLRLGIGESEFFALEDSLRFGLLTNPSQATQALTSLHRLADDLMADRRTVNRTDLREYLLGEGIALRESVDYQNDFRRLEDWTATALATHHAEGRITLTVGGRRETILRPVVQSMAEAVRDHSFIVVGDAGSGKTGCLMAVTELLRADGVRVWYWAADSLPYSSTPEIAAQLRLEHQWAGIFAEAVSGTGAILIIDGLDGLRDSGAQRAYRDLSKLALRYGVKVIVSIRSFDFRYALDLQDIFPSRTQPIDHRFVIEEFRRVKHVAILEANDDELVQVFRAFPELLGVLTNAPQLLPVIRNLFSLDLLCRLISEGVEASQLSSVSTQAELFEMYWSRRVTAHEHREEMEEALTLLIEQMVREQTLQVRPSGGRLIGEVGAALFGTGIIRHPPSTPGRLPTSEITEFSHHLLFDYAAERLFIRPRRERLAAELLSEDTWGLFLRPSLILFFAHAWRYGRQEFWEITVGLQRANVPFLQRMLPYLVVALEALSLDDLRPLIDDSRRDADKISWARTVQGIVAAAAYLPLPATFRRGEGEWWLELAHELVLTGDLPLVYAGRHILFVAESAMDHLPASSLNLFNRSAITLVRYQLNNEPSESQNIKPAIKWVCRSIGADPTGSAELIRQLITSEALQRAGYIYAYEITSQIQGIWEADADLAVEIYDSIFGYSETDRSPTPISGSLIMSLTGNRQQDYELAYYVLGQALPAFLVAHPEQGTLAVIKAVTHLQTHEGMNEGAVVDTFRWDGRECRIRHNRAYGIGWFITRRNDQANLLESWQNYLAELARAEESAEKWGRIAQIIAAENESSVVWKSLLEAGARAPEFYASRLWTLLINPIVLLGTDTRDAAEDCIEAFVPHLDDQAVEEIEATLLGLEARHFPGLDEESDGRSLMLNKARLLQCIPQDRRGEPARAFLESCDSQMIGPRQRHRISGGFMARDVEAEVRWPNHQDILNAANSLRLPDGGEVTEETLPSTLAATREVERLLNESREGIDPELVSIVEQRLTEIYSRIACANVTIDEDLRGSILSRFQTVLATPSDEPTQERLVNFDNAQYWDPTDERINATEGFVCLSAKAEHLSDKNRTLLRRLSEDPEPRIRYHLGRRMWSFLDRWDEFVWETLERWTTELRTEAGTVGVLTGTFRKDWFWWLRHRDAERADRYLRTLTDSARARSSSELIKSCGSWLAVLAFRGERWAHDELISKTQNVPENLDELNGALGVALGVVLPRDEDQPEPSEYARPATEYIVRLLQAAGAAISAYLTREREAAREERAEEPSEWVKPAAHMFDNVAIRFRFAAESQAKRCVASQPEEVSGLMISWWDILDPVLDALLNIPHPAFIYHLIEGLEQLVDYDVERSIRWIRRATIASAPEGLTTESMAADKSIGILERILGENRASLATGTELRADFIQTLEAYLQQGWPRALILASKLDGIYR